MKATSASDHSIILKKQLPFMEAGQTITLPLPDGSTLESFHQAVASRANYGHSRGFHGRCRTTRNRITNTVVVELVEE